MPERRRATWLRLALVLVTVACAWLTFARLRVSSDVAVLFPERGDAAALARFVRAFGGGDFAAFLVRGADPADVEAAAGELAKALEPRPSVAAVLDRAPAAPRVDPTLAWAYAGPAARATLARALTPAGMRERLEGTRALLLAPGDSEVEEWLARDPLRLSAIPWEGAAELAAGVRAMEGGAFVADEGRARLVVARARGNAFERAPAHAFMADARAAIALVRAAHPGVTVEVTGGHAIAEATETLLERDLAVSGTLSLGLAALAFVATFRRARALVAVLPPLVLGTLWTTGLAALWPSGLSAIAIAFAAVVVGVGVDTGVHVYDALLDGRRRGLSPAEAARHARRQTWQPTLTAAAIAALAFGSLVLSDLAAAAELGVLCGAGEVLTAVAILIVTPEIGAWLERGAPPPALRPVWLASLARLTSTRGRAAATLGAALLPVVLIPWVGLPRTSGALVAVRPDAIEPVRAQDAIYATFGGRPGQWVVLTTDADPERARARADDLAEALAPLVAQGDVAGFDALATWAPSRATEARRLAERDALDLPGRTGALADALREAGLDVAACAPALDALAHPSHDLADADPATPAATWLLSRHVARDSGGALVATYVRPSGDPERDARALAAIRAADPVAVVTGYGQLDRALRESLARDLPRVGLVAFLVVAVALRAVLRSAREVAVALGSLVVELAALAIFMRVLGVRWHVYDAIVVPVLVGITIDESMFLLHAARRAGAPSGIEEALRTQGPLVAATALTTAAGFVALMACRYRGLFDLGEVGTLGVVLGLVSALVVVPAGLRLARGP
jgi:uncharacterized protein